MCSVSHAAFIVRIARRTRALFITLASALAARSRPSPVRLRASPATPSFWMSQPVSSPGSGADASTARRNSRGALAMRSRTSPSPARHAAYSWATCRVVTRSFPRALTNCSQCGLLARANGTSDFIAACGGTQPLRTASSALSGSADTRAIRRDTQLAVRPSATPIARSVGPWPSNSRTSHPSSTTERRRLVSCRWQ
jgi:hypothetical protein